MIITSIGLLGVAALQGTAISQTKKASDRTVAAAQLSNLVARMKSARGYWQSVSDDFSINIDSAGAITDLGAGDEGANLTAETTDCSSAVCDTATGMASYSLRQWAQDGGLVDDTIGFNDRLTNANTTMRRINRGVDHDDLPVLLEIDLSWSEKNSRANVDFASFNAITTSNYRIRIQP